MKQLIPVLLACAVPFGTSYAQDETAQEPTASERFDALEEEVEIADEAWVTAIRKDYAAAEEAGEELPPERFTRPYAQFVPKFQAAATDYAGTEDAVQFLGWLATTGMSVDEDAGKAAIDSLFESHIKSEGLEAIQYILPDLGRYYDEEKAKALVAQVEKESPVKSIRAWATWARLKGTLSTADVKSEEFTKAKAEMMAALEDVDAGYLGDMINGEVTVREKFSIGMVAPDIDGLDLDGTEFKLSDYKGKVLFVDFWGDW